MFVVVVLCVRRGGWWSVGAAVLATLLRTMMMFCCVVSGAELVVAGDVELPTRSAELSVPWLVFWETFSPRLALDCCIYYSVAGTPAFLSPCHWGLALPQELSFSCNGEFGETLMGVVSLL